MGWVLVSTSAIKTALGLVLLAIEMFGVDKHDVLAVMDLQEVITLTLMLFLRIMRS